MPTYNERVNYEFTADNSSLAKTISKNIDLLDAYGKRLNKFASESLAATTKEIEALEKQVTKTTSVATNLTSVFSDFKKQVDKFSTGFNWMDEAIRKQEKLTKSARESADVFRKAYAEQNKFNASIKGVINNDAPTKSARESASVFSDFQRQVDKFSTGFNWIDEAIRKQEKLTKSARDSANVFKQAYIDQNRNNASIKGVINNDAPTKSARDAALVFSDFQRQVDKFSTGFNRIDEAIRKQEKLTKSARESASVFIDFYHQVDKFSTGFNWVDEAIRKQEKLTKSARESADVFKRAYADQNRNNASGRGVINVATPNKSAAESADVFNQFFENQGTKLGGFLSKFSQADGVISSTTGKLAALGSKVSMILAVLTKIFAVVKKLAPIVWEITKAVTKFVTSPLKLLQLGAKSLTDSFKSATSAFRGFGSLLGVGAGASLGVFFSEAAKNASDMAEAINLFNVAMKNGRAEGTKWIANLSEMSGMDMTNLMSITGLFYEMGAAVEMPHQAAMKLSKDLTELSMDISSLFNVDLETVTQNMTSGIRGMSRAVIKYGMDVRASTVEAFARANYGITEQYETMNETNRIILRYLVMLNQANDANSDFARTIEQPANQLRVFKQQMIGLSREVGRFVVNVIDPLLPKINGLAMALRNIIKFVADFLGLWNGVTDAPDPSDMDDTSDGIEGIGKAASGATKSLKRFLAPFDELTVLTKEAASGSSAIDYGLADPRLLQALEEAETKFGKIEMLAHRVRDAVLGFFGFEYVFDPEQSLDSYIQLISGGFADKLIKAFQQQDFTRVGELIAEKLNPAIRNLADSFDWDNVGPKIRSKLGAWIDGINGFLRTLSWTTVGETLGNLLKTTFETINFAALSFDWTALGTALADSLTGFFEGFNIESVGVALANVLTSIADFAASFAKNFEWEAFGTNLGNSINTFFSTWDAKKLGTAANQIITKLITMINTAIETTDWELVGAKIAEFLSALEWGEILGLLGKTIWNALKGAVIAAISSTKAAQFNKQTGNSLQNQQNAATEYYKSQGVTAGRHFATGGVVTGPTRALIGEAGRAEMVMPLDNSPQMQQFISQIADAVRGNNAQPTEVHVYLDSRAVASTVYDELHNVGFRRGTSLIR